MQQIQQISQPIMNILANAKEYDTQEKKKGHPDEVNPNSNTITEGDNMSPSSKKQEVNLEKDKKVSEEYFKDALSLAAEIIGGRKIPSSECIILACKRNHSRAAIFSKLFYWAYTKKFGTFYKKDTELIEETLTTTKCLRLAKKFLVDHGIFSIKRKGRNGINHYTINIYSLIEFLKPHLELGSAPQSFGMCPKGKTGSAQRAKPLTIYTNNIDKELAPPPKVPPHVVTSESEEEQASNFWREKSIKSKQFVSLDKFHKNQKKALMITGKIIDRLIADGEVDRLDLDPYFQKDRFWTAVPREIQLKVLDRHKAHSEARERFLDRKRDLESRNQFKEEIDHVEAQKMASQDLDQSHKLGRLFKMHFQNFKDSIKSACTSIQWASYFRDVFDSTKPIISTFSALLCIDEFGKLLDSLNHQAFLEIKNQV